MSTHITSSSSTRKPSPSSASYARPSTVDTPVFPPLEEIDTDLVSHLILDDPVEHFNPWYFSLRSHLRTIDPRYEELLGGSHDPSLYPYERELSKLLVFLCIGTDAMYGIAGRIRRNKLHPGSAALQTLEEYFLFDELDYARRLETYLQGLPKRPPSRPGRRHEGPSPRLVTLRETFSKTAPITKAVAPLPTSHKVPVGALEKGDFGPVLSSKCHFDETVPSAFSGGLPVRNQNFFAEISSGDPITKASSPLPSLPIEGPEETEKGDFGPVLSPKGHSDVAVPTVFYGLSVRHQNFFAEISSGDPITKAPSPQPSLTLGVPTATFPIQFHGELARTAPSDSLTPLSLVPPAHPRTLLGYCQRLPFLLSPNLI